MPEHELDEVRLDFAFTQRDTPKARERIEGDLRHIARAVREADPHLRALVLTGGFSRGEGTVRDDAPVNDYDLVAIRDRPSLGIASALGARMGGGEPVSYPDLAHALSAQVGIEVDLLPVWRARLPRLSPKLFWLDAKLGARVISGDARVLDRIPAFTPTQLGRREAARLLGNRAAGLLLALPGPGRPIDAHERDLQATKAVLAAMDARLLARGEYAATMRERLQLASDHPDASAYARAVQWKLGGNADKRSNDWWNEAADVLIRAVADTRAEDVNGTISETLFHLLKGGAPRRAPSQDVRRAAWSLLRVARFPDGPASPDTAARSLARIAPGAAAPWPALRERFAAARARTLQ